MPNIRFAQNESRQKVKSWGLISDGLLELSVDPKNAIDVYCASQIQLLTRLHASDRQGRRD
jgi:hypothetical protein